MRQVIANHCATQIVSGDFAYLPIMSLNSATAVAGADWTEIVEYVPPLYYGVMNNLWVTLDTAVTTGSVVVTLYKNGVETPLKVTITSGTTGTCFTEPIGMAPGDYFWLFKEATAHTPSIVIRGYSVTLTPVTAGHTLLMGTAPQNVILDAASYKFNHIFTPTDLDATESNRYCYTPTAGTLLSYRVDFDAAVTVDVTSALYLNSVAVANSPFTITIGNTSGNSSTMGATVPVGATFSHALAGTTSASTESPYAISILIRSTNYGESTIFGHTTDDLNTTGTTEYIHLYGGQSTWGAIERYVVVGYPCYLKDFRVNLSTAPGAGKSYTFTVRKNGADTNQTLTISDTSTSMTSSVVLPLSPGDLLSLSHYGTGTPTAADAYWGMNLLTHPLDWGYIQGISTLTA